MWKRAAKKQDNYVAPKNIGKQVTTSGTISTSNLVYTQTVYDNTAATGKAISYRAYSTFTWYDTFFWDCYDNQVAFGWGGNLATMDVDHTVTYRNGSTDSWTQTESPVNAGLRFTTPQAKTLLFTQIKSGYTGTTLYQNQKQNYDTKVLPAYGHKMLIASFGISVSASGPSVSLRFSSGFDYSPQASTSITY